MTEPTIELRRAGLTSEPALRFIAEWAQHVGAAQVQVIATQLSTGSGGSEVTLKFIGLKQFQGVDDEIADRDDLVGGDMVSVAIPSVLHDIPGRVGDIADMDKRTRRHAPAVIFTV